MAVLCLHECLLQGTPLLAEHHLSTLLRQHAVYLPSDSQGHTDDIKCMAISPDRQRVASGQVGSAAGRVGVPRAVPDSSAKGTVRCRLAVVLDVQVSEQAKGSDRTPYVCIWDTSTTALISKISFPPEDGVSSRFIGKPHRLTVQSCVACETAATTLGQAGSLLHVGVCSIYFG